MSVDPNSVGQVKNLTALGTTQTNALQLRGNSSFQSIGTAASGTGVILPTPVIPSVVTVENLGANAVLVYPQLGGTINDGSVNAALSIGPGGVNAFTATSLTNWSTPVVSLSGFGTVSSVTAGGGLAGGTITTTGTLSLAAIADQTVLANTSGGAAAPVSTTLTALIDEAIGNTQGDVLYRGASAWSALAPGSSGQVLASQGAAANPHWATVTGTGTVTSVEFVGDGTVLSSTPSSAVTTSGTIAGALANAPAYTHLANQTGSSAAPTYTYGMDGTQVLSATSTTLTNASPSYNVLSNASGNVAAVLPAASTCPGKIFAFTGTSQSHVASITLNAADTFQGSAAGATFSIVSSIAQNGVTCLVMISGGAANTWYCITNSTLPILALITSGAIGTLLYSLGNNNGTAVTAQGTAGQMLQGAGGAVPTWTSTPGSGTAFTSIGTKAVNNSATQTTVSGSAGSYIWSQPEQGSSYKNVVIYLSGYTNASTSAIVFATAFTQTPIITANGTSLSISTISASGVTIPAATTQTGFIILAGY